MGGFCMPASMVVQFILLILSGMSKSQATIVSTFQTQFVQL